MKLRNKILIPALPLLLLLGCLAGGIWYLRSEGFREFAQASLVSRLEQATGLHCEIAGLQMDIFRGSFVVSGLELSPRAMSTGLISARVQQIRASISISSFWHLRVRLRELRVISPYVELKSGGGDSTWNPEDILKNLKVSLRLEAAKAVVEHGWIKINNQTAPFHLSVDDLDCEIRYAEKLPSYKVRLEYTRSLVFWEGRDILHGLKLLADVSLKGVEIESFEFRRPGAPSSGKPGIDGAASRGSNTLLTGNGSIRDWKTPVMQLHLDGVLDAKDLVLATPSLNEARGNIEIGADLHGDKNGVSSKGTMQWQSGTFRKIRFNNLKGTFDIAEDVLRLRNVSGRIAAGSFLVNAEIQLREANKDPNRVAITTKNVPVLEAGRFLDMPRLNLQNTADSSISLTWYSEQELRADCFATLHGMEQSAEVKGPSTPFDGDVQFKYYDSSGLVHVESINLRSHYSAVRASEGQGPAFHVQLSTARISEPLDLIASLSDPVADLIEKNEDIRKMEGIFSYDGDVRLEPSSDVECTGNVSVKNGRWRSYKADSITGRAHFHSPLLELRSLLIRSGQQSLDGDLDLEIAEGEHISKFGFTGNANRISLSSLKDYGIDTSKVAGLLSGAGSMHFENKSWKGDGRFSVENGSYEGMKFDGLEARVLLDDRRLRVLQAEARRAHTTITAKGKIDFDSRELSADARLQGLLLQEIPLIQQKGLPASGRIGLSGVLRGTIDNPAFTGDLDMDALQYASWNLGGGKGRVEYADGSVRGNAAIQSKFGNVQVWADIGTGKGYPGSATLKFENLDIQKIVTAKLPSYLHDLTTAMEGKLQAEGNFETPDLLTVRGEVDGAHFRIRDYELHNDGPMQFAIANRNFRMESVRFVGEGTSLSLSGTIPLDDNPQLDLNLSGGLNLALLDGIEGDLHTTGAATLNIRVSGSKREPQMIGQASFHNTRVDYKDFPFRFSAMQGDIVFSRNLVRFENVRGAAASGTIQLSGIIELQNAAFRSINMTIAMRNARIPFPKDFRTVANADLVLNGSSETQVLSGNVDVLRMEYVRSFNLLEQLASHGTIQSGPLTTDPFLMGLRLNVEIHSENGLSIDNELTRLRGSMRLTLRGTPAYPSLTGRVEASEGTIFFRGSRFEITRAAADFVDRNRINPVLEIRAEADVKTYRLILDAMGDIEHLNLNVTSDPPMSMVDILSLLTTGKTETGTETSQRESQLAGMSAASVLSENLTGAIGKRVQRIFGFESFRVDPFLAGAENDPTARITISERLSKDLVVTFSRNLSTNQEQIVVIEYDVGKNISVIGTRDEDGKFGLDFRLRKRLR
jgi:autotransporter translocation and assembly factor TamB